MKTVLPALFLISLLAGPIAAHAMAQPIFGMQAASISAGLTRFSGFNAGSLSPGSTITNFEAPVPISGTVSNLQVSVGTAPGAGTSHTFSLIVNGVADSNFTCTIADTNTTCSDTTHSVAVSAGDRLAWRDVTTAGTVTADVNLLAKFEGSTDGEALISGTMSTTMNANSTAYMPIFGSGSTTTPDHASTTMPTSGTMDNMYIELSGAPTAGKSYAFTLYKNGAATSITCTISDTNENCTDLSATTGHTASFGAGDSIYLQEVPTGTPTARTAKWGFRFRPTTNGESPTFLRLISFSNVTRWEILQGGGVRNLTEEPTQSIAPLAFALKNLYFANIYAGPDVSESRTITFRNGGVSTSLSTTVNSSTLYALDADSANVSAGDLIAYQMDVNGTPPTSNTLYYAGATVYVAPSAPPASTNSFYRFYMMSKLLLQSGKLILN
jgi:hypothetical protein